MVMWAGGESFFCTTSLSRTNVGVCYTRDARSRVIVRVVGKEGALGRRGVGVNCSSGMDGSRKMTS